MDTTTSPPADRPGRLSVQRAAMLVGPVVALAILGLSGCSTDEAPTDGEISLEERPTDTPILAREDLQYVLRGDRVIEISFGCPSWGVAQLVAQNATEVRFQAETTFDNLGECVASDCFILDSPLGGRAVINDANGQAIGRVPDRFTDCPLPEE